MIVNDGIDDLVVRIVLESGIDVSLGGESRVDHDDESARKTEKVACKTRKTRMLRIDLADLVQDLDIKVL